MDEPVLFDIEEKVAVITLNRPDRRNAINQALLIKLYDCLEEVERNSDISVAVLTGSGTTFCAGLDLSVIVTENLMDPREDGTDLMDIVKACKKPLIGAINGHAITGGFELALNCDFLIASENASFADTHAKIGIHPGWGMSQLLQDAIGRRRALQMSLSCRFINAEQAFNWGLVNEVVPSDALMTRVKQIAKDICSVNPYMMQKVKNLIEYRRGTTLTQALAHEKEDFTAFLESLKTVST
ncbi:MAG: enoyl-CoA hydratase [Deltaproteobacteria bacterium]|nr:enoyl-CoA hydratase [Deltaproteobacteria bacterium]